MRIVLDANVLVSALLREDGQARKIVRRAATEYTLVLSDFLLIKTEEAFQKPRLRRKASHITPDRVTTYITELRNIGDVAEERSIVTESTDPEDNRIIAAAIDGTADYLVTYNTAHFLNVTSVHILDPSTFQKLIRAY
jgi:putative PIN family toxin of toxin-antitoxin system